MNSALIVLMLTLGAKIGSNDELIGKVDNLGFQCIIIAILSITGSVLVTFFLEKMFIPLNDIKKKIAQKATLDEKYSTGNKQSGSKIIATIMPSSIIIGIALGYLILPNSFIYILDYSLFVSLSIIYISVGIDFGANKGVLQYLKFISWKIIFIPVGVIIGSILGGFVAALILKMSLKFAIGAACGMSYYSLTGATLTQALGIEAGTYGFIVNVAREVLTVILLPVLIKISPGSAIASGAAGNMDTMLVPITKYTGSELGPVTLIIGIVLTFFVPVLLSVVLLF